MEKASWTMTSSAQLNPGQGASDCGLIGRGLRRIGACNPERLDVPVGNGLKHLYRCFPGVAGTLGTPQSAATSARWMGLPMSRCALIRLERPPTSRPPMALGARQGKRRSTRTPDMAGGQMQVNQRRVFGGAAAGLVKPLAIQTERCWRGGKQLCRLEKISLVDAAGFGHQIRGVVAHIGFQGVKAGGVRRNKGTAGPALPQHDVQHAIEKRHVGARLIRQIQIGNFGGIGALGVTKNYLEGGVVGEGFFKGSEKDRMRIGCVAANDENTACMVYVRIAGGGERLRPASACSRLPRCS